MWLGASAPLLTNESLVHFSRAKGGSAILPKLVKLVGWASTLLAEELSPYFARSAAASSCCLVLRLPPWQDVTAC